ncbi:hypothetical protein PPTG_10707 [Phytophthora nicotianae INRA-310]|uniref:Uncharacterized protein n=1 Tax=Phytophthora nicotianae (strain INRA-310) TaxID=761204 RepID=W2QDI9_PHYN3|nr:hypothetical protein PPTG_10707 [Phytophthora nicotianae INRA-310]ETN10599.1 hypothetical protein PPTG_10707 [Phytophthora nicotianae INRA-310]
MENWELKDPMSEEISGCRWAPGGTSALAVDDGWRSTSGAGRRWKAALSRAHSVGGDHPLRNVSWAFLDSVVDSGRAVYFFAYTCGDIYLEAARNANALALPPLEYACALVSLAFLIPIAVLQDYESRFGITGRLCLRWCEVFHHSCCLFAPDAVQLLWVSTCRYARATGEATVAVIERTGDFVMGVYLAVTLLLSLLVYLPRLVYESVEAVLGGPIGVVAIAMGCIITGRVVPVRRQDWGRTLERLRGVQVKGTPTEAQAASVTSDGTPTGGILEVAADKTVRPSSGEGLGEGAEGRSGRTVTVYS